MILKNKHSSLAKNTFFLYVLTFSNQILGLFTIPYLTRIFGPSIYGELGMALSLMTYIQIILDFGFILSATELIAVNRDNRTICSTVFSTVIFIKIILILISALVFLCICMLIPSWRTKIVLYALFYFAYAINSLLPDFVYRGMEQMKTITIRTVFIKILFTVLVFILIKDKNDLLKYPIILGIGNLGAVIYSVCHVRRTYDIHMIRPEKKYVSILCSRTIPFFVSRIASTFYQAATTIILGSIYVGQDIVGFYSSADKLMSLTKSVSSPVADSLYPYMVKNKDYKLIKIVLMTVIPIITIIGIFSFIFAEKICIFLFGTEYGAAKNILRCMIPAMIVIFPTYILSFPVLVPMGLSKKANMSNIIGAVVQSFFLIALFCSSNINAYSIIICGSISEIIVFLYRLVIVLKNCKKHKTV